MNMMPTLPPRRPAAGAALARHMEDRHRRAARVVGYGLAADDARSWWSVAFVLAHRLTLAERGALAFAALVALEPAERAAVIAAVMEGRADG